MLKSSHLNNPGRRAVFFDRDGTLNEMIYDETHGVMDSPRRPEQVHLVPGAADAVSRVRSAGNLVVVVTNQPGLAKGTMDKQDLALVNNRLHDMLRERGAEWDAIYYCPHHPVSGIRSELVVTCECRKPKPGLLVKAAKDMGINLLQSWMIGDGIVDIEAGKNAGCRAILFSPLKLELITRFIQCEAVPDFITGDLTEAADFIVNSEA